MAPNARLIMFVLISAADPDTAAIPDRFTPSLEELAGRSGLSKSAVAEWLTVLEDSGWVKRDRPSTAESFVGGRRTRYQLAIGDQLGSPKPKRERKRRAETTKSSEKVTDSTVRTADSPHGGQSNRPDGPHGGQSSVRTADSHGPHGGHKSSPSQQAHLPPTGAAPAGAADALFELDPDQHPDDREAEIRRLTGALVGDWVKHCAAHDIDLNQQIKQRFGAAIKKLLLDETDPDLIRSALILMREKGKASRAAMLHEFVIDVQNQRSIKPAHAAAGKGRVSTKASIKKWKKDQ